MESEPKLKWIFISLLLFFTLIGWFWNWYCCFWIIGFVFFEIKELIVETIKEEPIETPKPIISDKDIDAIVQERVEKIMESKAKTVSNKIGRPKKYMNASKVISVRLDSETYDFVRKKGRTEYNGITEYINALILKEM